MQPYHMPWSRRHVDPRDLDPRLFRVLQLLGLLAIVTIVMVAVSIACFSIALVLQALDGILLTLQAVLLTIEHGDIFLRAVLCALLLLVVITCVTRQYGHLWRRLFHLSPH